MSIRQLNGHWHYRFMLNGHRHEASTGLEATKRNESAAKAIESKRRLELIERREGIQTLRAVRFSEAAAEWLAHSKVHATPGTHQARKVTMTSALIHFGNQVVRDITTADIDRYIAWRLGQGVKKVSTRNNAVQLGVFFNWARKAGYCRESPVVDAAIPSDKDSRREHPVTAAEEALYFAHATGELRDLAKIMLLQGCRPHEVLKLKRSDIDLPRGYMTVGGKTEAGQNRRLKMTPETAAIIEMRLQSIATGEWLFPSPVRPCEHLNRLDPNHDRLVTRLGLAFVLYDFRHTFATRMIEAGIDIVALKYILGHTKIEMTLRYVHLAQEAKDSAMEKYSDYITAKISPHRDQFSPELA